MEVASREYLTHNKLTNKVVKLYDFPAHTNKAGRGVKLALVGSMLIAAVAALDGYSASPSHQCARSTLPPR